MDWKDYIPVGYVILTPDDLVVISKDLRMPVTTKVRLMLAVAAASKVLICEETPQGDPKIAEVVLTSNLKDRLWGRCQEKGKFSAWLVALINKKLGDAANGEV